MSVTLALQHRDRILDDLRAAVAQYDALPAGTCPADIVALWAQVPGPNLAPDVQAVGKRLAWTLAGSVSVDLKAARPGMAYVVHATRASLHSALDDLATWQWRRSPLTALQTIISIKTPMSKPGRVHDLVPDSYADAGMVHVEVFLELDDSPILSEHIATGFTAWLTERGGSVRARRDYRGCSYMAVRMPADRYRDLVDFPTVRYVRSFMARIVMR